VRDGVVYACRSMDVWSQARRLTTVSARGRGRAMAAASHGHQLLTAHLRRLNTQPRIFVTLSNHLHPGFAPGPCPPATVSVIPKGQTLTRMVGDGPGRAEGSAIVKIPPRTVVPFWLSSPGGVRTDNARPLRDRPVSPAVRCLDLLQVYVPKLQAGLGVPVPALAPRRRSTRTVTCSSSKRTGEPRRTVRRAGSAPPVLAHTDVQRPPAAGAIASVSSPLAHLFIAPPPGPDVPVIRCCPWSPTEVTTRAE